MKPLATKTRCYLDEGQVGEHLSAALGAQLASRQLQLEVGQLGPSAQWVKGGGLKFFLQLGSTGTFLSNFKVPRASFHFPHPIFLKFGTSRAQKLPKNSPNWPKWRFEGSGGPKWLEQGGTKLERTLGGPGQGF